MCKANGVCDAISLGYNGVANAETSVCVDNSGTLDNDRPRVTKGKVDIIAKKKQTDANNEIYYAINLNDYGTLTTPKKTNTRPILISS